MELKSQRLFVSWPFQRSRPSPLKLLAVSVAGVAQRLIFAGGDLNPAGQTRLSSSPGSGGQPPTPEPTPKLITR